MDTITSLPASVEGSQSPATSSPLGTLHVETRVEIEAPASATWQVFGEGFARWSEWSDGILASSLSGPLAVGVIRTNEAKGLGVLTQELTEFDRPGRTLTYEIRTGMPAVIRSSRNRWTIDELGPDRCRISGHATFELAWWAFPLSPLLRRKMAGSIQSFAAELATHVERS